MNLRKLLGGRVIKTGLSVFITAAICQYFDLPVVFAVIAAIVTIEPTAAASVKKGMIRLPAAAIGAAFAMFFDFLWGQTPLTFALSAVFTIVVCHKLRWDDAILVATLTATAMIPETEDHFLMAFFVRLATTSIGIIISTLVNFLLLPPRFAPMILELKNDLYQRASMLMVDIIGNILYGYGSKNGIRVRYHLFNRDLERAFQYVQFQREEWQYRKHNMSDIREFTVQQKELDLLQKALYHLGNLISMKPLKEKVDPQVLKNLEQAAAGIAKWMVEDPRDVEDLTSHIRVLKKCIHENDRLDQGELPSLVFVCYELLAIAHVLLEKKKSRRTLSDLDDESVEKKG